MSPRRRGLASPIAALLALAACTSTVTTTVAPSDDTATVATVQAPDGAEMHRRAETRLQLAAAYFSDAQYKTALEAPTRPMRPVSSGTPRQRSWILESGLAPSIRVWPTSRFITWFSGMVCSSRMASMSTLVDHNSVARWLSQMESRPNFSPMNCCNSSLRIGSSVA